MNPLLLLPEMLLFGGGLGVLIGGSFLPRRRLWITRAAAATALVAAIAVAAVALAGPGGEAFEGTFRVDTSTGVARIVAAFAVLLVLALASDEIAGSPRESETYASPCSPRRARFCWPAPTICWSWLRHSCWPAFRSTG